MSITLLVPFVSVVVGLLVSAYVPRLAELGRALLWCGLLVLELVLAHVRVGP